MKQLVVPNLNAIGYISWCLRYAGPDMFGTTYVPDPPFAWTAWLETKFKLDSIPTDVTVLNWYSFFVKGVNQGHVTASVPGKGFYSSPYSPYPTAQYQQGTSTHAVLPSISEVERIYGCKYVGSSLDILGLKVAEGGQMTQDAVEKLVSKTYRVATDIDATPEQAGYWVSRIMADNNTAYELCVALGADDYKGDPQFRYKGRHYSEDMATAKKQSYDQGFTDGGGKDPQVTVNGKQYVPKV